MVGQQKLLTTLLTQLPRNLILSGDKLSGKKTLINELSVRLDRPLLLVQSNVDAIREIGTYNYVDTIYLFADIDDWSTVCMSAILKLLEENTNNWFVLTCRNIQNIPNTVQSRCQHFAMEPYTQAEIGNPLCTSVGQAMMCTTELQQDIKELVDDALAKLSFAELLTLLEKLISLKAGADGYDFELFFSLVESYIYAKLTTLTPGTLQDDYKMYLYITAKYNAEINLKSLNKQKFLMNWLLDMKGLSYGYQDF